MVRSRLAARLAALALLSRWTAPALAQEAIFQDELMKIPPGAKHLFAAEANGDGKPDLIVVHTQSVSVLSNLGAAQFAAPKTSSVSYETRNADVGDLNNDGLMDLVASLDDESYAGVFLSTDPPGTLTGGQLVWTWDYPWGIALGDLTGDGMLDLVTGNEYMGTVSVLIGAGGATFGYPTKLGVPLGAYDLDMGDLDADGDLDVAACGYNSKLAVLLNQGGALYVAQATTVGSSPYDVDVAELDGDGSMEIVVASSFDTSFAVANWNGHALSVELVDTGFGAPVQTAVGDVTGDGLTDVFAYVKPASIPGKVGIFAGSGTGTLASPEYLDVPMGSISLADLDGDSVLDLVGLWASAVRILPGLGSGEYLLPAQPQHLELAGKYSMRAAVGDLNGDAWLDVVTSHYSTLLSASVLLSNGPASFDAAASYPAGGQSYWCGLADFDADGELDLAALIEAGGPEAHNLSMRKGDGLGGFGPASLHATEQFPNNAVIADLDLDGRPDAATCNFGPTPSSSVSILRNDGSGGFDPALHLTVPSFATSIEVAELSGDLLPELVVGPGVGALTVLDNLGGGTFAAGQAIPSSIKTFRMHLADVDADGVEDLVSVFNTFGAGGGAIELRKGMGTGAFSPLATLTPASKATHDALAADFDADGRMDIAASSTGLSVFRGLALPAFAEEQYHASGVGPRSLLAADVDHDGRLDVIASEDHNTLTETIVLHRNLLGTPDGLYSFALGTPSCGGRQVMLASVAPSAGETEFALTCTNAPRNAHGFALVGSVGSYWGVDPFALGVILHVDPLGPVFALFDAESDGHGAARVPLPIPPAPGLGGMQLFAQGAWIEPLGPGCSASWLPLSTSLGLQITIAP